MLVLRPGALGDTLLAVPALRALRRALGEVTLAAHGPTARLLGQLGEVDTGMAFDDPSLAWVFRDDEPPVPTVAWMSIEHAPALRHALLVAPSRPVGPVAQHVAAYLLQTLAPLGIAAPLDASPLRITAVRSHEVLVHVGSGSPVKNWPAACFAETIALLDDVTLIVGEADGDAASAVEERLGRPLPRIAHPSLLALAARLAGCRAYLGNDSGVSHLAGLSGAPSVVLFGPTSPTVWRPLGPRVQTLLFTATPREVAQAVAAASAG